MKAKPTKRRRARTGGPAPFAEGRELVADIAKIRIGRAMTIAQWGRFNDEDLQAVGYALGAILEMRKRPDYIEPEVQREGAFGAFSHGVKNSQTLAEAQVWEGRASAVFMQWITASDKSDLEAELPARLRVLADLLEARPLKPSPNSSAKVLQPRPVDQAAYAVCMLAFEASKSIPRIGSRSFSEIKDAIAALPKETRDACIAKWCPGLEERRVRKLIGLIFGIKGSPGRPKKSD